MTIGTRVKAILNVKNMQQKDLAKGIGVPECLVSRWCNNKTKPSISKITLIADYLGVSLDELLGKCKLFDELLIQIDGRLV